MGCSSGPNSLLPTWQVVDALDKICQRLNHKPPTLHVFLNDLPGNDFNTVFQSLPSFYERLKKEKGREFGSCLIAAAPGSFYGSLFPPCFLHFVYSSYSLHWLSQVPKAIISESGIPILNKRGVCVAKSCCPPTVHKVYLDQFESDFTKFLKLRTKELKPEGRMVLTFIGNDKYHTNVFELIGIVLSDMVSEGLLEESKLESFNFPFYTPTAEEVRQAIQREGSFNIHKLETFHISWLAGFEKENKGLELDKYAEGKYVGTHIRAVSEPLLASHFGNAIMDDIFHRYSIKAIEHLEMCQGAYTVLLISLINK